MTRSTPHEPVRDLLAAVLDAIAIPYPATVGDSERYRAILEARAMHVTVTLRGVLDGHGGDVEWTTARLREQLDKHPAEGYRAWGQQ